MENLLINSCDFNEDVYRNIVSLRKSENLFDDLSTDEELTQLAVQVEAKVKSNVPNDLISRGFYYSTAIGYPFQMENTKISRYSDGSFPVWYGSLELDTSIHETAFHMARTELHIEGLDEIVVRERAVYKVNCKAILIDLINKRNAFPQLVAEDYSFTQQIGHRLHREGHPGLLAPSARYTGGNTVIFNHQVLSNVRSYCYLTYQFDPRNKKVTIEREPGKKYKTIKFDL